MLINIYKHVTEKNKECLYNCDPFVFGPEFAIDKIPLP